MKTKNYEKTKLVRTDIMLRWEQILWLKENTQETGESGSNLLRRLLDEYKEKILDKRV